MYHGQVVDAEEAAFPFGAGAQLIPCRRGVPIAVCASCAAEFADEHDVVRVRRERLPHNPAGHVGAVVPGSVEDPDATLVCGLHRAHTRLGVGGLAEDPGSGQPHGPKAHPRYGAPTERNAARMICQTHVVEAATIYPPDLAGPGARCKS